MFSTVLDGYTTSHCSFKHVLADKAVSVLSGKEAGSRVAHIARLVLLFQWAWVDEKGFLTECCWWSPVGTEEKYW